MADGCLVDELMPGVDESGEGINEGAEVVESVADGELVFGEGGVEGADELEVVLASPVLDGLLEIFGVFRFFQEDVEDDGFVEGFAVLFDPLQEEGGLGVDDGQAEVLFGVEVIAGHFFLPGSFGESVVLGECEGVVEVSGFDAFNVVFGEIAGGWEVGGV